MKDSSDGKEASALKNLFSGVDKMDYFKILNLSKEPFSNSPDPDFFCLSREHVGCLQKIELSLRLRRGLSVVIGDVGAGKTTLCRQLIRKFSGDEKVEAHLILDPHFSSSSEFLCTMVQMFGERLPESRSSDRELKEIIKKNLFRRGVDEKKTVVLIIDEGQKLPDFCLEILREFLNYETNQYKLLQIVIFAQTEFDLFLRAHENIADRMNLYHVLPPLNFQGARSMIRFRLEKASNGNQRPSLFSYPALWAIYKATGGYPRKIVTLCHRILLNLIIANRTKAGWITARSCAKMLFPKRSRDWHHARMGVLIAGLAAVIFFLSEFDYVAPPGPRKKAMAPQASQVIRGRIKGRPSEIRTISPDGDVGNSGWPVPLRTAEASIEPSSQIVAEKVFMGESAMPQILGEISVGKQEWLAEMIRKVYGVFSMEYLRIVVEENRGIEDPDIISPGQVISFPAVPVKFTPLFWRYWWVEIRREETLQDAYRFVKQHSSGAFPLRIVSTWSDRQGLRFNIWYGKHFDDEESARIGLKNLPSSFSSGAKILSDWEADTVFFASPMV
jgi:general secretion pathway protein A